MEYVDFSPKQEPLGAVAEAPSKWPFYVNNRSTSSHDEPAPCHPVKMSKCQNEKGGGDHNSAISSAVRPVTSMIRSIEHPLFFILRAVCIIAFCFPS